MDNEKIGNLIKERRKMLKLTQVDLAEKLDVTDKTISKWECGRGCPDISIIEKLSETLNISILELLNGEEIKKIDDESNKYLETAIKVLIKEKRKIIINILKHTLLFLAFVFVLVQIVHINYLNTKEEYNFTKSHSYFESKINEIKDKITIIEENSLLDETDIDKLKEIIEAKEKLTIINLNGMHKISKKDLGEIDREDNKIYETKILIQKLSKDNYKLEEYSKLYVMNYAKDIFQSYHLYNEIENASLYESIFINSKEESPIYSRILKEEYEIENLIYTLNIIVGEVYE